MSQLSPMLSLTLIIRSSLKWVRWFAIMHCSRSESWPSVHIPSTFHIRTHSCYDHWLLHTRQSILFVHCVDLTHNVSWHLKKEYIFRVDQLSTSRSVLLVFPQTFLNGIIIVGFPTTLPDLSSLPNRAPVSWVYHVSCVRQKLPSDLVIVKEVIINVFINTMRRTLVHVQGWMLISQKCFIHSEIT